jgi:bacillopeptidase F
MSQSIMMIGIAVVLFFTFIFVIIPNFFNFISNFLDSSNPFQEADVVAPQIPIISAPVSATSSAQLKISGFGEPKSSIIFVLNGAKEDKITVGEDGAFETDLTLDEGENKISAYSTDEAENESAVTKEYVVVFDAKPPSIEVIEPADGTKFETRANQTITIKGKTDDNDPGIKIYVAGRLVFPKDDGTFSYSYSLKEGENKIEIIAQDKAGNTNKTEVTYTFSL